LAATSVYGEWNVRIKPNGNGCTINVNVLNVSYETYNTVLKTNTEASLFSFKSTGIFEQGFADLIK
jgi:hypothetical protein